MADQAIDILGPPYLAEQIELPDDDEGPVVATLVSRAAATPTRRAVLHVHGYCDYFFHTGIADFYVERGYDFYALDLRKHGRSLLPHQTPNFCTDITDCFPELDEAMRRIRARDGHERVVISAHSTGGLVTPLWADVRRRTGQAVADGFVLNSPWLDLAGSLLRRTTGSRAVDQVARRQPYRVVPRTVTGWYVRSLHRDFDGEWEFDLSWKPRESFPARAGWLSAIRRGHRAVHRGIDCGAPVLVLTSARSSTPPEWGPEVLSTDIVLDVAQIARWSPRLAPVVTVVRLDGALHDVFLSAKEVREQAYGEVARWLAAYVEERPG